MARPTAPWWAAGRRSPSYSLSGGRWAIGQAQHRERHARHRVITPAVARPYISPGQVTSGPQTPRFARRVEALDVPVLVRGAIAVPGRCTCVDSAHSAY